MKNSLLLCAAVLLPAAAAAEEDHSQALVKATELTSSLYMLEGAGGNMTASLGPDGVLMVDDDFAPMADKLVAKLRALGGDSPRYIVNTHFHYDHTGGNEVFGGTATIIAATAVRERLMQEQTLWRKQHPPVPAKALPTLTFDGSLTLYHNDDEVRILHLSHGHTDGDTVVFFTRGKVVSMGDLYFSGMYPIFHPEHEGGLKIFLGNVETVLRQTPSGAKIVPGHGPLSTRAELEKYRDMIVASIATVEAGIKSGHTQEEIRKAGLAPQWEPFSHGYRTTDQWLLSIYQDLSRR